MDRPSTQLLVRAARRTGRLVLDTLLPPHCLNCGVITEAVGTLCLTCWARMTFLSSPLCRRCGHPFDVDAGSDAVCGECLAHPPCFARARAVFRYDDASRGLVLGFKHADKTGSAPAFARWMARAGAELLAEADLIIPVPLHRWRLLRRRYNQAALLANALAGLSATPCLAHNLRRVRHTPFQGTMGRQPRRRNIRGAFRLADPAAFEGKRVLLVDDVFTTGATIEECARTLLGGGARAVDVLTLARVVLGQG